MNISERAEVSKSLKSSQLMTLSSLSCINFSKSLVYSTQSFKKEKIGKANDSARKALTTKANDLSYRQSRIASHKLFSDCHTHAMTYVYIPLYKHK